MTRWLHPSYATPHPTLSRRRGLLAPFSCGRRVGMRVLPGEQDESAKVGMHPTRSLKRPHSPPRFRTTGGRQRSRSLTVFVSPIPCINPWNVNALKRGMSTITKRFIGTVFAVTQGYFLSRFKLEFNRREVCALMAPITKGLIFRLATTTPEIGSRFKV